MSDMAVETEFDPIEALERALTQMKGRSTEDKQNRAYVEGDHPRLSWVEKIKKVFGPSVADQIHQMNYCGKAVDSPVGKMEVTGFDNPTAEELFRANKVDLSQRDLYRDAFVIDSGYVILAETDEDSEIEAPYEIVVQRAEDVYVEPASLRPHDRAWAVKVTADPTLGDEGGYRAWVWDTTTVWRYVAPVGDPEKTSVPAASGFTEDPEDPFGPHGFDRVPVVPFALGRDPHSILTSLRPIQDRIDMLEVMKVVAGLFGASHQRVFFTSQDVDDEDVEASPDFSIVLDPGNPEDGKASVTEFTHTPLENYDAAIDREIDRFHEIARLPKHGRVNPGGEASGEAVKADDGDSIEFVNDHITAFTAAWREVFALLDIDTEPTWAEVETRNELTQMQVVKAAVDSGVPLEWALTRFFGLGEDDLAEFRKAKAAADAAAMRQREAAMLAAEQGRDDDEFVE